MVAVGGSGVGGPLLRRVVEAHPYAAKRVPGLRMVVVTGPRIDPATVPVPAGVGGRGYVAGPAPAARRLRRRGRPGRADDDDGADGAGRPFLYFPLLHHFEQQIHVAHRLERHRAGTRMHYDTATPESIGEALAAELDRPVAYRAVPTDGARRAAALIAELV